MHQSSSVDLPCLAPTNQTALGVTLSICCADIAVQQMTDCGMMVFEAVLDSLAASVYPPRPCGVVEHNALMELMDVVCLCLTVGLVWTDVAGCKLAGSKPGDR